MVKNTLGTINTMHRTLSPNSIGIWRNNKIHTRVKSNYMPRFFTNTSSFCKFEIGVFENAPNISYHLTGYGILKNESLIRFLGESAERFTFTCINKVIKSRIVEDSIEGLKNKAEKSTVVPLEYIKIYEGMDINEHSKIFWVKMNSFNARYDYVYIPAAFVIMGWELLKSESITKNIKSVSTGTACHQTVKKALESSIVEYLQLDSANLWWQSGIKGRDIPDKEVNKILEKIDLDKEFSNKFYVKVTDISFDKPIYVYTCEIFSKDENLPKYAIGIQGGMDSEEAIYRGIMEALTILEYVYNYKFINEKAYDKVTLNSREFYDLDSNVVFYSKYGKEHMENDVEIQWNNEKYYTTKELFKFVSKEYEFAGFLDITIDDFSHIGFNTTRVIIPELLPLYLPSLIPVNHPRFKQYEVKNYAPHPMP